jgi:hypothetical protein
MSNLMIIRTRYIDERLLQAIRNGIAQFVILGAGLDTRPYRFAEQLKGKKVFEVDYQSTQELKKRRLKEILGVLPQHVSFTEIDFKKDSLSEVLSTAGYRRNEKSFFIWEGVSMYLPESAVRATLNAISADAVACSDSVIRKIPEVIAAQIHYPLGRALDIRCTGHAGKRFFPGVWVSTSRDPKPVRPRSYNAIPNSLRWITTWSHLGRSAFVSKRIHSHSRFVDNVDASKPLVRACRPSGAL